MGWLRASAPTRCLISLVSVKWSCWRINKQAFPPQEDERQAEKESRLPDQVQPYITQSVLKVVLQKSIPTQNRQLIFNISNSKGQDDGFVWELTSAERL